MQLVVASLKRIQARAYNNAKLIKLADRIRQFNLSATIDGDKVRVQYDHEQTTIVCSVRKLSELIGKIPCQYCHERDSEGIVRSYHSLVCEECYASEHGS